MWMRLWSEPYIHNLKVSLVIEAFFLVFREWDAPIPKDAKGHEWQAIGALCLKNGFVLLLELLP